MAAAHDDDVEAFPLNFHGGRNLLRTPGQVKETGRPKVKCFT
jgi:hypothetical protein